MAEFLDLTFLSYFKVLIVAILIYVIIYAMLVKLDILGAKKEVNALIALLAAIIVSFSGVVTYAVSYAINWFVIIIFIVFLLMILLMFLGVSSADIVGQVKKKNNARAILIAFGILFLVIIVKGFFALNNAFDVNAPPENQYEIDTTLNTGVDDMIDDEHFFKDAIEDVDRDIWASIIFLLIIGVFVWLIGRS